MPWSRRRWPPARTSSPQPEIRGSFRTALSATPAGGRLPRPDRNEPLGRHQPHPGRPAQASTARALLRAVEAGHLRSRLPAHAPVAPPMRGQQGSKRRVHRATRCATAGAVSRGVPKRLPKLTSSQGTGANSEHLADLKAPANNSHALNSAGCKSRLHRFDSGRRLFTKLLLGERFWAFNFLVERLGARPGR